ncbi:MAG: hypothetical protein AAF728_19815, partial [Cyanobacteria bacterium P01_D01_bin.128]
ESIVQYFLNPSIFRRFTIFQWGKLPRLWCRLLLVGVLSQSVGAAAWASEAEPLSGDAHGEGVSQSASNQSASNQANGVPLPLPVWSEAAIAARSDNGPYLSQTDLPMSGSITLAQVQALLPEMAPVSEAALPSVTDSEFGEIILADSTANSAPSNAVDDVEIDPAIIEQSPTLQRWLQGTPDLLEEIRNDPSFRTRIRVGYANFPSSGSVDGVQVGVEDVFIGRTGLTLSGDYGQSFNGDRESYGINARYYVLPLGGYFNVAPVLGYRAIETAGYSTSGLNLGIRLQAVLSRTGAADLFFSQSWVSIFGQDEVGITSLGAGYAVTQNLRLSTEIQWQNSRQQKDSRVGVFLEWMFF